MKNDQISINCDFYKNLEELSKDWEVSYSYSWNHLNMTNHGEPVSIKIHEFLTIYNFIKKHNLKFGYEVATAFGISALAASLAMKDTNGNIVTMDAYIEENSSGSGGYDGVNDHKIYENSCGFKSVNRLIKEFQLENILFPKIGWSPTNTLEKLSENFNLDTLKLDYIFIDSFHTAEAAQADLQILLPYINKDRFALFFHDWHCVYNIAPFVKQNLGTNVNIVPGCEYRGGMCNGFNLAYGGNI